MSVRVEEGEKGQRENGKKDGCPNKGRHRNNEANILTCIDYCNSIFILRQLHAVHSEQRRSSTSRSTNLFQYPAVCMRPTCTVVGGGRGEHPK